MFEYKSISELVNAASSAGRTISEVVLADQAEQLCISPDALFERMDARLSVMEDSVKAGMNPALRSTSGLTGGDASRMWDHAASGGICGGFTNRAIARALAVSENNAAMGKIVAAPTAGSCGILPGAVVSMLDEGRCSREAAVMALFTAGAFGMVIAQNASIAGAEGGCQAECGSAAAMAAAALVELMGGTPQQCAHACAMAIKNQLGLVCDPVAGLVEIPCIKRNVSGVTIAFSSAEMALAGIESKIPADECIGAMREVGCSIPSALRETAKGGLGATPTGERLREQVFGSRK
ncbi:MAG TPA: L-serine ammonia-lyase, iron-sulfur-dependent, subunit alpha [Candidatus Scatomorpha pullicola]|nr:L-serine ammonia-lyase, iron-sulfur-dependent, subunit alpha [Candidatus Scatomorpha pullicola]